MFSVLMAGTLAISVTTSAAPYRVDPPTDLVMTGGMLALAGIEELATQSSLRGGSTCPLAPGGNYCDKSKLLPIDRSVVGNHSAAWRNVSDIGQYAAFSVPVLATSLDAWLSESDTPVADAATETLVMAEAMAATTLVTGIFKLAVRRARPAQYVPGRADGSIWQDVSFLSGHSSAAATAGTAYATTFWLNHPDSPARFLVVGAAVALAGVTGYGRIAAGEHFYTDVLAGFVLGGTIGWLVPQWHRADTTPALSLAVLPSGGATITYHRSL